MNLETMLLPINIQLFHY